MIFVLYYLDDLMGRLITSQYIGYNKEKYLRRGKSHELCGPKVTSRTSLKSQIRAFSLKETEKFGHDTDSQD